MGQVRFYTKKEEQILKKEIETSGKSLADLSRIYGKRWRRSPGAVYVKLLSVRDGKTSSFKKVKEKGITLPLGWSFDINNIKRAVLYSNNSVRLYF